MGVEGSEAGLGSKKMAEIEKSDVKESMDVSVSEIAGENSLKKIFYSGLDGTWTESLFQQKVEKRVMHLHNSLSC